MTLSCARRTAAWAAAWRRSFRSARAAVVGRAADRGDQPQPISAAAAFEQAQLDELAASIAEHGVLQPILVTRGRRRLPADRRRAAAAGRRRWPDSNEFRHWCARPTNSAQLAWALIENLQRSDLNALEEAAAFRRLVDEFWL